MVLLKSKVSNVKCMYIQIYVNKMSTQSIENLIKKIPYSLPMQNENTNYYS